MIDINKVQIGDGVRIIGMSTIYAWSEGTVYAIIRDATPEMLTILIPRKAMSSGYYRDENVLCNFHPHELEAIESEVSDNEAVT